jgi:hypothetical protein
MVALWSHYGDGLRGFCIKYDAKVFFESLKELNNKATFDSAPVNYVKKPHEVDTYSMSTKNSLNYIKSLQNKHEHWSYECECRILCNSSGFKMFLPEAVHSIFIGGKMLSNQESLLIDVIEKNYPIVEICQVFIDENSYGVKVVNKI